MISKNLHNVKIKVIGVGGAGCNAIDHMIESGLEGTDFIYANTDTQALLRNLDAEKINLGYSFLKGLGAGGDQEVGKKSALQSEKEIKKILENTDLLFIVSGLGGGTGTGAGPIIARFAQEMNILVIGAVTKPFTFEGKYRKATASQGIEIFKKHTDSLIIISNDKLLESKGHIAVQKSFRAADENLKMVVETITSLIAIPAKINLDFADIKRVFAKKNNVFFGYGSASGKTKVIDATKQAVSSKLLEASVKGLKNAIINFTGGQNTTLFDINNSIEFLKKEAGADSDINIIFGLKINKDMQDNIQVAIIGTDFDESQIDYADQQVIEERRQTRKEETITEDKEKQSFKDNEEKTENDHEDDSFSSDDDQEFSNNSQNLNKDDEEESDTEPEFEESDLPPFMKG